MLAYRVARLKNATVSNIADFSRERDLGCRARDRRGRRLRIFEFFQHRFPLSHRLGALLADMLSAMPTTPIRKPATHEHPQTERPLLIGDGHWPAGGLAIWGK